MWGWTGLGKCRYFFFLVGINSREEQDFVLKQLPVFSGANGRVRSKEGGFFFNPRFQEAPSDWEVGEMCKEVGWWFFGSEFVHCFICPYCTRAVWPLRMWLCTSPGMNGVFLMRFKYTCTLMSCWRTLHLCTCWVRPAHPPPSSEPGSAFLLFLWGSYVLLTYGPWALLSQNAELCPAVSIARKSATSVPEHLYPQICSSGFRVSSFFVFIILLKYSVQF